MNSMEVYTAIPLIPRSSGNGASPHLERIRSHNARSVVKVLLVLIALITLLSVIIAHAIHKEHSHARSLELKLNGEDKLIDVKAIQDTKNPALDLDTPKPKRYLRGTFDGPVIHRVIFMDSNSGSIEIHSQSTSMSVSSLERELQSMMHLEQEVEEMFAAMTMMTFNFNALENFFNGPLSGFDALDDRSAGPCFRDTHMIENKALEEEAEVKRGDTPSLEKNVEDSKSEDSKSEDSKSENSKSEDSKSEDSKSEEGDRDLVEEKDDIPKLVSNLASDEDRLSVL
jgi:hypothetical protein